MSLHTPIEWCDSTVNPTSGCDGCELFNPRNPAGAICYARAIHEQRFAFHGAFQRSGNYAKSFSEVRMIPGRIAEAARWGDLRGENRAGKPWLDGLPRCIFVGDLSDIMSAAVTDDFLEREIFAPMESDKGRRHIWMVLTKRPKRLADFSERRPGGLPRNVIAMTSVTNQATAEARLPHLRRVQARWRGVSAEPLLGAVSLAPWLSWITWVIIGGASGDNAGQTPVEWIEALARESVGAACATFVKQLGSKPTNDGGALAINHAKGGNSDEWPASLRVREMPSFDLSEVAA